MIEQSTYDDGMLDITAPDGPVEVKLREDRQVLWVNINGKCRLRVCRIDHEVIIESENLNDHTAADGDRPADPRA
jgi:hypothetical protein